MAAAAPVGIFVTDEHHGCTFVNREWEQIAGISADDAHGGGWIRILPPEDRQRLVGVWELANLTRTALDERCRIVTPDGRERHVHVRAVPLLDQRGDFVGFVGSLTDLTTVVHAEDVLTDARDRALAASALKSRFLANMSHEIRTPISGILGLAELLTEETSDRGREYLDALAGAGEHLLRLVNDILDLSKIEAGKLDLEYQPLDPGALVREVAALLAGPARAKAVELDLRIDESVPDVLIGDSLRIRQVVTNLVANAIKFTEEGSVRVALEASGPALTLTVVDTGIGLGNSVPQDLVAPFAQADASTTRRFGGTGLGLAICRELLEIMGGHLLLQDTGTGTAATARMVLEVPSRSPMEPSECGGAGTRLRLKILIAEDNAVNQIVLSSMVRKLGFDCDVVENGQLAVAAVTSGAYDLVLMDCQMPVLDGYGATRAIRALPGPPGRVPIVAVTASAMAEDRERCLRAGMNSYLSKPVSSQRLYDVAEATVLFREVGQ